MNQTEPIHLVEESRTALQAIRRSLIDLYEAIGANPEEPQEVARRYTINRNLTWKLSRVIGAADPFAALNHLPGQPGIELAMNAFEKAGAPAEALGNVRSAMNTLFEVVREHAGDREHLELTLESMGLLERDASAETGRELAFRGNSSVWGVQAKTRMSLTMLAPGASSGAVDYVMVSGLVGFRRLRPTAHWRLYRRQMHDDKGRSLSSADHLEEIEEKKAGDLPMMLREFCSPNMPELISGEGPEGREILLPGGQVGNRAAFDCYFGYIYRNLPGERTPQHEYGSTAASVTLPAETMVFDLVFHRDLRIPASPDVRLYGFPLGGPEDPSAQTARNELPLHERVVELAGMPPAVATPHVPRLARIVDRICTRMGWRSQEFRGLRVLIKHPPMLSRLVMRWPLV